VPPVPAWSVATGWAGLSWDKAWMMLSGVGNYFLIVGGWVDPLSARRAALPLFVSVALQTAIFLAAVTAVWPRRAEPRVRAVAIVFLGTLGAGQVLNLYSQPQDPQMQINVMAWLTVGWAVVLVAARENRRYGSRLLAALSALSVLLFAYNVWSIAPLRGLDSAWENAIKRMERESNPDRTVWLMHDFDWAMVYGSLYWGTNDPGVAGLGPAPQKDPKFKWIGFTGQVLRHPDWSDEQLVDDLRGQIDHALDLGYDVLVIRLWDMDPYQLEVATGMVASSERIQALRTMLREDYVATQAFIDPVAGAVDRLKKRPGR